MDGGFWLVRGEVVGGGVAFAGALPLFFGGSRGDGEVVVVAASAYVRVGGGSVLVETLLVVGFCTRVGGAVCVLASATGVGGSGGDVGLMVYLCGEFFSSISKTMMAKDILGVGTYERHNFPQAPYCFFRAFLVLFLSELVHRRRLSNVKLVSTL
ncbi:hypothetical protein BGX38DRAFT_1264158 [Terfezia claveryi]|nr:hypothetical protein BGX38DRAFT_1264158 [Terfezia claveryi]